jgi:hypothetical protein
MARGGGVGLFNGAVVGIVAVRISTIFTVTVVTVIGIKAVNAVICVFDRLASLQPHLSRPDYWRHHGIQTDPNIR